MDEQSPKQNPEQKPQPTLGRRLQLLPLSMLLVGALLGTAVGYFIRQPEVDALRQTVGPRPSTQTGFTYTAPAPKTPAEQHDTDRVIDINTVATQLEVYYNDNGGYPVLAGGLDNDQWVRSNLKGMDLGAMRAPGATKNSLQDTGTPDSSHYGYKTFQADNTTPCSAAPCPKFALYYYSETDNKVKVKYSLN